MSVSLILSDIHGRTQVAQNIIDSVPHDRAIFLGDFFDFKGDNYFDSVKTAGWVKNQLDNNPKFITCVGNHDIGPRFPYSRHTNYGGFTREKSDGINTILSKEDWNKFLPFFYHEEGNWLISHAGLDPRVFDTSLLLDLNALQAEFTEAFSILENGGYHRYFAAGYDRGGSEKYGGVTWIDFNTINPLVEYNQIVGHTILKEPTIRYRTENKYLKTVPFNSGLVSPHNANKLDNDIVVGLDTNNRHYALITDGILTIHETNKEWMEASNEEISKRKRDELYEIFSSLSSMSPKNL